jgi:aspartate racemase
VSTLEYYRIINRETNRRLGGHQAAECVLYSINFGEVVELKKQNREGDVFFLLRDAAHAVENAGAECIVLCANTMHKFADALRPEITLPIVHIAEATVGLLGTKLTMELDFYKMKLKERRIETLVPEVEDRDFIERTIMDEILNEILNPKSRERFLDIIRTLHVRGAEGIILGCTEIPLLVKQEHTDLPLFDTLTIHARAAVDFALSPGK